MQPPPHPPRSKRASLAALPTELHLAIASYLSPLSLLALSHTNGRFLSIYGPMAPNLVDLTTLTKSPRFLLELEQGWFKGHKHYACFHCYRILPAARFADTQIATKRSKGREYGEDRYCIECGIRRGRYKPGWWVTVDRVELWVCRGCRKAKRPPFCGECGLCQACYGGSDRRHVKELGEGHCVLRRKGVVQAKREMHKRENRRFDRYGRELWGPGPWFRPAIDRW